MEPRPDRPGGGAVSGYDCRHLAELAKNAVVLWRDLPNGCVEIDGAPFHALREWLLDHWFDTPVVKP